MSVALAKLLRKSRSAYSEMWQERSRSGFAVEPADAVVSEHLQYWDAIITAAESGNSDMLMELARRAGRFQFERKIELEESIRRTVAATNMIEMALLEVNDGAVLQRDLIAEVADLRSMMVMAIVEGYREALAEREQRPVDVSKERLRAVLTRNAAKAQTVTLESGDEIGPLYDEQMRFYAVDTGKVRLYSLLPNGRTITLSMLGEGDVFFQWRTQETSLSVICAEAMQRSTLYAVRDSELIEILSGQPAAALDIISNFARRLTESQVLIEDLMGNGVNLRLYRVLGELARELGRPGTAAGKIDLALTHQRLADMIGSNRVTITRKLHDLQRRGVVGSSRAGTIEILDLPALEALVQSAD